MNSFMFGQKNSLYNSGTAIKNRSVSYSSLPMENSPPASIASCSSTYSLHHTVPRSEFSIASNSSNSKRFHSSHLGKPPGSSNSSTKHVQKLPNAMGRSQSAIKIAPMKEVEKMITDLKKENFDLKLRLYHLEDMMSKDLQAYQLKDENCRLKMNLEDRNKYVKGLEQDIATLLRENEPKTVMGCSTSTQTDIETSNPSPITEDSSYHTAFESTPEAFGLFPVAGSTKLSSSTKQPEIQRQPKSVRAGSWQRIVANEDHMKSVVSALQKVKIDNNSNIVDSWLNQNVNDHQRGTLSYPFHNKI